MGLLKKAFIYPIYIGFVVVSYCGYSVLYTEYKLKQGAQWRSSLLAEYQLGSPPSVEPIVPKLTQLSSDPPMWRVPGFMSEKECDYVMEAYKPAFSSCFPGVPEPLVYWLGSWASTGSPRICQNIDTDIPRGPGHGNEVLESIEQRILETLRGANLYTGQDGYGRGTTSSLMEVQVVRYRRGGKFRPHFDESLDGTALPLTFMVYLNDGPEGGGGGTSFPRADAGKGLEVDPRKGDLLVWTSCGTIKKDAESIHEYSPSNSSYHTGLQVEGPHEEKWILNFFYGTSEVSCHDIKRKGFPILDNPFKYIIGESKN